MISDVWFQWKPRSGRKNIGLTWSAEHVTLPTICRTFSALSHPRPSGRGKHLHAGLIMIFKYFFILFYFRISNLFIAIDSNQFLFSQLVPYRCDIEHIGLMNKLKNYIFRDNEH